MIFIYKIKVFLLYILGLAFTAGIFYLAKQIKSIHVEKETMATDEDYLDISARFSKKFFFLLKALLYSMVSAFAVLVMLGLFAGFIFFIYDKFFAEKSINLTIGQEGDLLGLLGVVLAIVGILGAGTYWIIKKNVMESVNQERDLSRAEIRLSTAYVLWFIYQTKKKVRENTLNALNNKTEKQQIQEEEEKIEKDLLNNLIIQTKKALRKTEDPCQMI